LCFGHAGGGASSFNAWRRVLPGWIELVKVQLPGREDRHECVPYAHIEDLLPWLYPHIEAVCDLPIALYGHSMGAILAFEVARAMRRHGHEPLLLAISGRRAPHRHLRPEQLMHHLPEPALVDRLLSLGGFPPPLLRNPRWRDHYLPTIRADLSVSDEYSYRAEPKLRCPLYAFLGAHDNLVIRQDWEAWDEMTSAEFARYLLPGGHFFAKEGQAELISTLTTLIAGALAAQDAPACAATG
jgi:medium-chain acyl-[acyl-carrier-protein] hydrolase